jgi:S-adenosylmethionine hydrolase
MITLTTDLDQIYVSQMKGAILAINPEAMILDIAHDSRRFDIRRASFALSTAASIFPRNTVHVCVVDPGVGSERKGVVVESGRGRFVGPDNGVFTLPLLSTGEIRAHAIQTEAVAARTGRGVSRTFHGRDVFAPVAALLDLGESADSFGDPLEDLERFEVHGPNAEGGRTSGTLLYVDGFGNLATNIPEALFRAEEGARCTVTLGGKTFPCLRAGCYADAEPGELILLVGSQGTYEVSLNRGEAAARTGGVEGDKVELAREDQP